MRRCRRRCCRACRRTCRCETLVVAGEACPAELAARWSLGRRMINAYGPTETTVCATMSDPLAGAGDRADRSADLEHAGVRAGRGLSRCRWGWRASCTSAGAGLARGYLDRPGLTAERFVADPFGAGGEPDVPHRGPGALAAGRRAGVPRARRPQVKLRGFRIELGEIEAVLRAPPGGARRRWWSRARTRRASKRLVAYVVAGERRRPSMPAALRAHAAARAAGLHGAGGVRGARALPLTPNGKLDRGRCRRRSRRPGAELACAARRRRRRCCAALFAEVLGLERVGVDDNFFELGGHSLLATRLVSRIRATLGCRARRSAACSRRRRCEAAGPTARRRGVTARGRPLRAVPRGRPRCRCRSRSGGCGSSTGWKGRARPTTSRWRCGCAGALDATRWQRALARRGRAAREPAHDLPGHGWACRVQSILVPRAARAAAGGASRDRGRARPAAARRRRGGPFDLATELPLRAPLFTLGERRARAAPAAAPHRGRRLVDGAAGARPRGRLRGALRGARRELPPLPVQYADYTLWQRDCSARRRPGQRARAAAGVLDASRWPACPRSSSCRPTGRGPRCRATAATACR